MWNRDQAQQPPENVVAPTVQPAVPTRQPGGRTVIGETMRIEGSLTSQEDVHFAGEIKGRIEVEGILVLGPTSKSEANIKAREATISGAVRGNVESQGRLVLRDGANLVGDVKTSGIVIEDGAYFKGGIDITRTAS